MIESTLQFDAMGVVPDLVPLLLAVQRSCMQSRKQSGRHDLTTIVLSPTLTWSTVYREILAAIKYGKMARNCLYKCLVNLKFGNSHDQIESYDIITRAALGHLKPL